MHFILIKPVLSVHLSYVTLFQCSLGRSHKTGLTVYEKKNISQICRVDNLVSTLLTVVVPGKLVVVLQKTVLSY